MHRAIVGITTFEPDEVDSRFILGMSDDVESFLMPQVISHLHRQHPRVTILVRQANRHVAGGQLESGVIDLALVNAPHGLDGCDAEDLFESTYACLYDGARLALSSPITLEEYVTAPHLLVSYEGVRGAVDDALELQGLSRRIVASTTHFSALMVLLRAVDAVATMPAHAARAFAAAAGLTISPPPLPMPTFTISCAWSRRRSTDPRVIWMRELLRSIVSSMPDLE